MSNERSTEEARLRIVPTTLKAANAFVGTEHRHHPPTRGHKFSVAVESDAGLHGVAIAGRPVARGLDHERELEVLRLCTDGTPNACSMLYGAVARVARAMGYDRRNVLTYILADEPGTSLRAAGWRFDGMTRGESWDRPNRRRVDKAPTTPKQRWRAA